MFAVEELNPGVAAVAGHEEPALGPAADELPGPAPGLPETGEDNARIRWIEGNVAGPAIVAARQHLFPGDAAIRGAVDAAFRVGAEGAPQHGRERDIGVLGMDYHRPDLTGLLPNVFPGFPSVGAFENAFAANDVAADIGFTGADVHYVGVAWGHGDRADGGRRLFVENRLPAYAAIARFPDTARGRCRVIDERITRHAAGSTDATARRRSDQSVFQVLEFRGPALRFRGRQLARFAGKNTDSSENENPKACFVLKSGH